MYMSLKNPDRVLEMRMVDGRASQYTVRNFYDDVMRDRKRTMIAKFWHCNDDWQSDTLADANVKRRGKRYSISRDSLEGPRTAGGHGFAAFDLQRFSDEADRLIRRGYAKNQVAWSDDDSIYAFFDQIEKSLRNATPEQARDIANSGPSIYLFTELMKRTEKLIEEELTELWARRVFAVRNLNTWLPTWTYTRESSRSNALPQYVNYDDVPSAAPRHGERRHPVVRPLVYFDEGASWTQHELWVMAEAVANGAANYNFDTKRADSARRSLLHKENLLAFFGDPEVGINGLMSDETITGVERISAPTQFGSGTAEADRRLLIDTAMTVIEGTEKILAPNMIGLSTKSWLHCIARRYGSVDNPSDQTVAQAALVTLSEIGISSLTWIPELGYRAAEKTDLEDKGLSATEATRLAGGIWDDTLDVPAQVDTMLVCRRDPEVFELIVAKDVTMYPAAEMVRGKTEIRMVMGSGGLEFYKPAGVKLVMNVNGENTLNYEDPA